MTKPDATLPHPRTRRLARLSVACLVLGALTTAFIAWVLAATIIPDYTPPEWDRVQRPPDAAGNPEYITITRYRRIGSIRYEVSYLKNPVTPEDFTAQPPAPLPIDSWARPIIKPWEAQGRDWPDFPTTTTRTAVLAIETTALGWPLPCLRYDITAGPDPSPKRYTWTHHGCLSVRGIKSPMARANGFNSALLLPYRPLPGPFLINTLFFAAVWCCILIVIPALRRSLRRYRGLCSACAYDLRATPPASPCPECGVNR